MKLLFVYSFLIVTALGLIILLEKGKRNQIENIIDAHKKALDLLLYPVKKMIQFVNWCKKVKYLKENRLMIFYDDLSRFYPERKNYCRYFCIDKEMNIKEYKRFNKSNFYLDQGNINRSHDKQGFIKLLVSLDHNQGQIENLKKSFQTESKFNL